ncbi:hypothetical protein N7444_000491 [Penicillium canescens]|nr:hypothetical protein N7444_000491 [Penicillium canescens]
MHNGLTVENCEAQLEENGSPHRVPSNIKTEARQDGAAELTSCSIAGGTIAPATTALPTTPGEFEPTSNAGQLKTGPNILDPNPPTVNYPEQPSTNPRGVDPCTVSLDSFYDLFEGSDTEESPTREGGKVTSTDPRAMTDSSMATNYHPRLFTTPREQYQHTNRPQDSSSQDCASPVSFRLFRRARCRETVNKRGDEVASLESPARVKRERSSSLLTAERDRKINKHEATQPLTNAES